MDDNITLKNQVEALLFSAGKNMDVETLSTTIGTEKKDIVKELKILKEEYNDRDGPLMIVEEGNMWKIHVREAYLNLVRKIVADTELPMPVLETLAVIAQQNPAMQAEVVKVRGMSTYEHVPLLQEMGFVVKEKFGRSFKLKLTEKFFEYFEIEGQDDIKKIFSNVKKPEPKLLEAQQTMTDVKPEIVKASEQEKEEIAKLREELAQKTGGLKDVAAGLKQSSKEFSSYKGELPDEDDPAHQEFTAYSTGEASKPVPQENGDEEQFQIEGQEDIEAKDTHEVQADEDEDLQIPIEHEDEPGDVSIKNEEDEEKELEAEAPLPEGEDSATPQDSEDKAETTEEELEAPTSPDDTVDEITPLESGKKK
ncbi:SMC-Scp complex subunit ScpB [Candidatus Woesearchaeota archaeon]|nr:SMC-Scp complex subunit ScpB [Candidatus Woesearchaeota archaeon]